MTCARPGLFHRLSAGALAVALLASSSVALAEPHSWAAPKNEPDKAALDEAKALYIAGNRAVEQGRWSDALGDFEKSYALSGAAAALFNVATTLRALGRHVEARDAFVQLLDKHPKLDPSVRDQAEKMLAEEKARIANIVVADLPSKKDDLKLFLDGKSTKDEGTRPLSLETDPGKHALRVEEPSSKPFVWEGTLADGEKKTVTVTLTPLPKETPKPTPEQPKESSSVFASPIFWTVVGVVVVGGAVTGGYLYHQSRQLDAGSPNVVKL